MLVRWICNLSFLLWMICYHGLTVFHGHFPLFAVETGAASELKCTIFWHVISCSLVEFRNILKEHLWISISLHGMTSQNIVLSIVSAVRTSNVTRSVLFAMNSVQGTCLHNMSWLLPVRRYISMERPVTGQHVCASHWRLQTFPTFLKTWNACPLTKAKQEQDSF
jgi:hypothetical protein